MRWILIEIHFMRVNIRLTLSYQEQIMHNKKVISVIPFKEFKETIESRINEYLEKNLSAYFNKIVDQKIKNVDASPIKVPLGLIDNDNFIKTWDEKFSFRREKQDFFFEKVKQIIIRGGWIITDQAEADQQHKNLFVIVSGPR